MAATVIVNGQTVVHKGSGGYAVTVDVCLTPRGSSMVPVPYSNIARSADTANGSNKLAADGHPIMHKDSKFAVSSGNPGKAGMGSGTVKGWSKFINYSNDTFVEGNPVCRRMDPMISNNGNTPPAPLIQPNNSAETETLEAPHLLSVVFVSKHQSPGGCVTQPVFDDQYTLNGPETFRSSGGTYTGGVHPNSTDGGEFTLKFDPFEYEDQ